jgi:hypothetical protein
MIAFGKFLEENVDMGERPYGDCLQRNRRCDGELGVGARCTKLISPDAGRGPLHVE